MISLVPVKNIVRVAVSICMVLLLSACQSELYSGLSEQQANEMVQVLSQRGIAATRSGSEGKYSVSVDRSNFSSAITELSAKGLPRQKFGSLGKIFTSEKLVSTPFEERARFMHALNEELSDSISRISGVTSARVHLMVPESSPFEKLKESPRASVFIYKSESADLSSIVPTIKNLVVNSLDNLQYENVEVAMFNTDAPQSSTTTPSLVGLGVLGDLLLLALLAVIGLVGVRILRSISSKPGKQNAIAKDQTTRSKPARMVPGE